MDKATCIYSFFFVVVATRNLSSNIVENMFIGDR
jgi:hypothetical protein